jgi:hypothetical protein
MEETGEERKPKRREEKNRKQKQKNKKQKQEQQKNLTQRRRGAENGAETDEPRSCKSVVVIQTDSRRAGLPAVSAALPADATAVLRASAPLEQQDKPGHSCGMKGAHHVKCL